MHSGTHTELHPRGEPRWMQEAESVRDEQERDHDARHQDFEDADAARHYQFADTGGGNA